MRRTAYLLLLATLLPAASSAGEAESLIPSVAQNLLLEREISMAHGRPVRCIVGPRSCHVLLNALRDRELPPHKSAEIVIVPPFRKKNAQEEITVLTALDILALGRRDADAPPRYQAPDWSELRAADSAFFARLWRDKELNIYLFQGYRDRGSGKDRDLLLYGDYALLLDRARRFAEQWRGEFKEIDRLESLLTIPVGSDRMVHFRLIDPHVFCADENEAIATIEEDEIERTGPGWIERVDGRATLKRDGNCLLQQWASRETKRRFLAALADPAADIIFYNGHSRFGTGPDFGPIAEEFGKIKPAQLIQATLDSTAAAVFFNGCSGGRNYPSLIKSANENGIVMIWNTGAGNLLDSDSDLFLFAQSVIEGRPLAEIERYVNLTQDYGTWPNTVKFSLPTERQLAKASAGAGSETAN